MLNIYRLIWEILTPRERRVGLLLMLMSVFMGLFETIGVAVILPFLQVLAKPELIQTNGLLSWTWTTFGFSSVSGFGIFLGAAAFGIILISAVVRMLTTYALTRFAYMRTYAISLRLLNSFLHQPYGWFLARNSATLGQTILLETDKAVNDCILPSFLLFANLIVVVFVSSLVFIVEPTVAISATLLLAGVYLLVYFGFRRLLDRLGASRFEANEQRFRTVQEATGGIKDVKVRGLEQRFIGRFREPALRLARHETYSQVISRLPRFVLEAAVYGGFILAVLVLLARHNGNIADLLPVLGVIGMAGTKLFPALQQVYIMMTAMRYMSPALQSLHHNLTTLAPPPEHAPPAVEPLRLSRAIEFHDVGFSYSGTGRPTLSALSLTIPARTTVGIVGGTGAGKTTMIDLILGLFLPDQGQILVDGVPIGPATISAWQRNLGYVPQAIYLSDSSIASNIAFGLPEDEIDMAAVERAARIANLHDFITGELANGYRTVVGERGVRLSGGQRQRIGIARALYLDPDVLILDEATSALDNLTERAVMEAVQTLGRQKTIIMIAHRLTTVQNCDCILLMEKGRILAQGTYDELVEQNATFRRMAAT